MFYHVRGTLSLIGAGFAVVEAGGIGYKLTVSQNTAVSLSDADGKEVRLFTHLAVREDGLELFGFYTEAELTAFKLLISVSGVGPKVALAVLSVFTPDKLAYAISSEDVKSISRSPGVGNKTAARIVLELRDKVSDELPLAANADVILPSSKKAAPLSGVLQEAADALSVLGYNRTEVADALKKIPTDNMSVEQIITAALRHFSK